MSTPWEVDDTVGKTAPATGRSSVPWEVDDTPRAKPAPERSALRKTLDYVAGSVNGPLEAGAQMITGLGGQAVGGVLGGLHGLLSWDASKGADTVRNVSEALTYQPVSKAGRDVSAAIAYPFEKANEGLGYVGGKVGKFLGNEAAGQTIGESALPVAMTLAPAPKMMRSARTAGERAAAAEEATRVADARTNAAKLDMLDAAERHGIATNPVMTNPTVLNRTAEKLAGARETNNAIAAANEGKPTQIIKKDLGVQPEARLDMVTLRAVRNAAAESSADIGRLGTFHADDATLANIGRLREEVPAFGAESATQATNALVDRVITGLQEGRGSGQLLKDIRTLRDDAQTVFNNKQASPEAVAGARARLRIANELEGVVENNLQQMHQANPYGGFDEMMGRWRNDRARMAKSYAAERALDLNTGQIDPLKIAKVTAEDNALTGGFADVGKIAGVAPEVFQKTAGDVTSLAKHHFYRSSPGAIVGSALGSSFGPAGMYAGGAAGIALSEMIANAVAKSAVNPKVQALRRPKGVTQEMYQPYATLSPADRLTDRPRPTGPTVERWSPEQFVPAGLLPGSPSSRGGVVPSNRPNWQNYQEPPAAPSPAPPGTSVVPGRGLTPEEQWVQDKGNFAAQDRVLYEREGAMDALAQQRAEAQAAALRSPAGRGVVLGETAPTGAELPRADALQRAVDKLASGRGFDLTAEERIAWNKAKGDIYAPQ